MTKKLLISVFLCFFIFSLGIVAQEEKEEKDKILKAEKEASGIVIYVDDAIGDDIKGDGGEKKPFKTLNKALSAANSEDKIKVGPGIYNESLRVRIDRLVIEGSGSDNTIINGGLSSQETILAVYSDYTVIRGFTILGGRFSNIRFSYVHRGIVDDCVIKESSKYGILVNNNSNAWIFDCQIMNNMQTGLKVDASSNTHLYDCIISENASAEGVGAMAINNSFLSLNNCEVKDHTGWGITILNNSNLSMYGCLVHNNLIGIVVSWGSMADMWMGNNKIYDNTRGGISLKSGAKLSITYADINNNNQFGIAVDTASILHTYETETINISAHEEGVTVSRFGFAFLHGALITGNNVGVHTWDGGKAICDTSLITGNTTDIISDCEYCQKK